jgi:hypothetical protein
MTGFMGSAGKRVAGTAVSVLLGIGSSASLARILTMEPTK